MGYNSINGRGSQVTPISSFSPEDGASIGRSAFYENKKIETVILEPQLHFSKNIGIGFLDILFGNTFNQNVSNGETIQGSGYTSDLVLEDVQSAASVSILESFANKYVYAAMFGRINYNFKEQIYS